jgi:DNA-3-methyladenine glycosylase I
VATAGPRRCPWPSDGDPRMLAYHDTEWGTPCHDDRVLFEFLLLESFQAGLSWRTVLHKRANFRAAFAGFDPAAVACFDAKDVARLLGDAGIIRSRAKIEAAIHNARKFLEIQREFGSFAAYQWRFVGGRPIVHRIRRPEDYPVTIPAAHTFAKDLKARGFKFLGPTTLYAHMQATGMVNDHMVTCFRHREVTAAPS